jgi:hypothetical protein
MSTSAATNVPLPDVSVTLSRPAYRLGGTVVGTVQVRCNPLTATLADADADDVRPAPRELLDSLCWMVVGRCRLDPRWHQTVSDYQKAFDKPKRPSQLQSKSSHFQGEHLPLPLVDKHTVCFWSTEPIELLDLNERTEGRWEDVKPKPIHLPGRKRSLKGYASSESSFDSNLVFLEDQQLAFTFRFELPSDLPHSVFATSCRYTYSILLCMQPKGNNLNNTKTKHKVQWIEAPLRVLTADNPDPIPSSLVTHKSAHRTSQAQVMAHSSGLSCHLTASELHQPTGQLTVNRHGAALFRHVRRRDPRHLQTMKIADPATNQPVCVLTIVGASRLSPGSRLILKLDFPKRQSLLSPSSPNGTEEGEWLSCYQASACLQGEEVAIHMNGTRKKARSLLLATAHENIDPLCTECACLPLMLPLDTPCSIQTSILEISIVIRVDITVGNATSDGYRNLQLEIPCFVMHGTSAYEEQENDGEEERPRAAFLQASAGDGDDDDDDDGGNTATAQPIDSRDPHMFPTRDIHEDMQILSLSMAEQCGLRPTAPPSSTRT